MIRPKKIFWVSILLYTFICFPKEDINARDRLEKLNYPNISKMLFEAYLDNDRLRVKDIVESKKYSSHRLYLLERAFFYGTKNLVDKEMSYSDQLKCKSAIWSISQDFAEANRPARWFPTVLWIGISTLSFLAGNYTQKKHKIWGEDCID